MQLVDRTVDGIQKGLKKCEAGMEHFLNRCRYPFELLGDADPWLANAYNLHKGERCFILGNGPSLRNTDPGRLRGEVTFGVNGIYLVDGFAPTYYVTISATFWKHHIEEIRNVRCIRRFIPLDCRGPLESDVPTSWLNYRRPAYFSKHGESLPVPAYFSKRPDKIVQGGGTVLFVCLQLAYYMGFKTAVILGVDHDYGQLEGKAVQTDTGIRFESTGRTHFCDNYHAKGEQFYVDYAAMERAYALSRKTFEESGRVILNATPGSKLETYRKVDYTSLFVSQRSPVTAEMAP